MNSKQTSQPADLSPEPLVRRLKGAPLSVLLTLLAGGEQSCQQLADATGWWYGKTREALGVLQELQLAQRTGYQAWDLCPGVDVYAALQTASEADGDDRMADGDDRMADAFDELWLQLTAQAESGSDHSLPQPWSEQDLRGARSDPRARLKSWADLEAELAEIEVQLADWLDDVAAFEEWIGEPLPDVGLDGPLRAKSRSGQRLRTKSRSEQEPAESRSRQGLAAKSRSGHGLQAKVGSEQALAPAAAPLPAAKTGSGHTFGPESRSGQESADDGVVGGVGINEQKEPIQKNQQQQTNNQALLDELSRLNPPFVNAAAWLETAPTALVAAWLRYLDDLERDARRQIRNEAAFLRAKIAAGEAPPPSRKGRRQRAPCPTCGKAYFNARDVCLVCAGVVKV